MCVSSCYFRSLLQWCNQKLLYIVRLYILSPNMYPIQKSINILTRSSKMNIILDRHGPRFIRNFFHLSSQLISRYLSSLIHWCGSGSASFWKACPKLIHEKHSITLEIHPSWLLLLAVKNKNSPSMNLETKAGKVPSLMAFLACTSVTKWSPAATGSDSGWPKESDGLRINTDVVPCDTIRMTEVIVSTFKASVNVRKNTIYP